MGSVRGGELRRVPLRRKYLYVEVRTEHFLQLLEPQDWPVDSPCDVGNTGTTIA